MSELGMRPSIEFMKEYFNGKPVTGVELGVFKGINAERLLSMLNIEHLHLVDLWITPEYAKDRYDYSEHEKMVREKFKDNKKVSIFKMDTVEYAQFIQEECLDFIYIDADHSYEGCKRDIAAWYPKIKKGGIMVGHDYYCCEGVNRAVKEFVEEKQFLMNQINLFDAIGINDKCKYGEWAIVK